MITIPNKEQHDRIKLALVEKLGLDPAQITNISARSEITGDHDATVIVEWSGRANISIDDMSEILRDTVDTPVLADDQG